MHRCAINNWLLALGALACLHAPAAGQTGFKAQLAGGTLTGIGAKSDVRLDVSGADDLVLASAKSEFRVPYRKVNSIEYGQTVSRRYAAAILISPRLLLSKSRKHFITLGFVDADDRQQALVVRVDKGDIRPALAALAARTGRRVEYQDAEARKAGQD